MKRNLLAPLALLALAACGSSPPSNFYVLAPLTPDEVGGRAPTEIEIRIARVELPGYVSRPEIVTRSTPTHIEQATFRLWGEPLRDGVARTLRTNLALLIPTDRVVFDAMEARTPDHHLMVYIERFDVDAEGTAYLDARWGVTGPDHQAGTELYYSRIERPIVGVGYDGIVEALSATIADLSREIADAIRAAH